MNPEVDVASGNSIDLKVESSGPIKLILRGSRLIIDKNQESIVTMKCVLRGYIVRKSIQKRKAD